MDTEQESCSICLEILTPERNPRLLPCSHSYCEKCLADEIAAERTAKNRLSVFCPDCRKEHEIPQHGFPSNRYIKEPTIIMQEATQTQDSENASNCDKHKIEFSMFCKKCRKGMCACCFVLSDCFKNGHDMEDLKQYQGELRNLVEKSLEKLDQTVTEVEEYHSQLGKVKEQIKKSERTGLQDLDKEFAEITKVSEQKKQMFRIECRKSLDTVTSEIEKVRYVFL